MMCVTCYLVRLQASMFSAKDAIKVTLVLDNIHKEGS